MPRSDTPGRQAARELIAAAEALGFAREPTVGGPAAYEEHVFIDAGAASEFLDRLDAGPPQGFVIVVTGRLASAFALLRDRLVEAEVDLPVAGHFDVDWANGAECDPVRGEDPHLQAHLELALRRLADAAAEGTEA